MAKRESDSEDDQQIYARQEVGNPMIVKIKLNKGGGAAADRACKFCDKVFQGGKALGGHMRIHNKEDGRAQKLVRCSIDGGNEENAFCKICSKDFPSMKSLYGHMRLHSDRNRRRVEGSLHYSPPPPAGKFSSSSEWSESDSGYEYGIKKWRGCQVYSMTEREAAMTLYLLSRGKRSHEELEEEEEDEVREDSAASIAAMYQNGYESDRSSMVKSSPEGMGFVESNMCDVDWTKLVKNKKPNSLSNGWYKCNICNKTFDNHRALGGHMAGHKKYKNHPYPSDEEEGNPGEESVASPAKHTCQVCYMSFSSGQALGGHMRKHSNSREQAVLTAHDVTNNSLDLNQPPPRD